ncbi:telomerase RNA component interacting RNase isoform X2 [Lampris incognitus]|uniref:telomerase RNA component interacting RNase isoform X2 n=1 Tax=Lampris incognitus TaxID=2546036 RepID=UPI0024B59847|nr:telomerase RNA component interacting RNase isoform X2 [Lampris incognitus]
MDPKRAHGKAHQSGSDSSSDSPKSPASPAPGASKVAGGNAFANDGSFMEMFKKKMEEESRKKEKRASGDAGTTEQGQSAVERKLPPVTSFVGKRRGGVFLKTGMVAKKQKKESETEPGKSDAWSKYMAEVKKYKAHQCGDDDKTRPLVK